MNIYEKLSNIQAQAKVNKNQFNKFGGYSYRSAEDILEAVKPICKANGCVLTLSDEIISMDGRFYVKATASLYDIEEPTKTLRSEEDGRSMAYFPNWITVTAYAREEETKKGMDSSQITGSCSSYARKYALNGLFNLDDSKDADTDAYTEAQQKAQKAESQQKIMAQEQADKPISSMELKKLEKLIKDKEGTDPYDVRVRKICSSYGVADLGQLKKSQYVHLCGKLTK